MRTKYNKDTQSWGVWTVALGGLWMVRMNKLGVEVPLKFQTKQEAQKLIDAMKSSLDYRWD